MLVVIKFVSKYVLHVAFEGRGEGSFVDGVRFWAVSGIQRETKAHLVENNQVLEVGNYSLTSRGTQLAHQGCFFPEDRQTTRGRWPVFEQRDD